jgi:deoxyhypusine synthase
MCPAEQRKGQRAVKTKKQNVQAVADALGLERREPLDILAATNCSEMLRQMSRSSFTGRTLGEAADVLEAMLRDERCKVVLTLTGAMTMAGLGKMLMDHIERGWIQCLVSTGALLGHGMIEDLGMVHYKADPNIPDEEYFTLRMDRVYDTLEPEQNLDDLEFQVRAIFDQLAAERQGQPLGTAELLKDLGRKLPGDGILQSAVRAGVPVIIPAFTDSELALDLGVHHLLSQRDGKPTLAYDGFRDLEQFRAFCEEAVANEGKLGIFTIGGGVPRNWAQQIGPYIDALEARIGTHTPRIRYSYGVRVCPDPVHYGHLSGCTYSEGVTWGKFLPESEGGRFAEVLLDATVGWPLLARAMIDRAL